MKKKVQPLWLVFLFRFWKPITFFLVTIGLVFAAVFDLEFLKDYWVVGVGSFTLTILFWIWNFEREVTEQIAQVEESLRTEIDENEERISGLFRSFNKFADKAFLDNIHLAIEAHLRFASHDKEHLIAKMVTQDLEKLIYDMWEKESYEVSELGVVTRYPGPFYKNAYSKILATNIVTEDDRYFPFELWGDYLRLNSENYLRLYANSSNPACISRIFIFDSDLSDEKRAEAFNVMRELHSIGVAVFFISREKADNLVEQEREASKWKEIKKVEDFNIFDANKGQTKYAGLFKDERKKSTLVTVNQVIISELEQQFVLLLSAAEKFDPTFVEAENLV